MVWEVQFTRQAAKQARKLNDNAFAALRLLHEDLVTYGPGAGGGWANHGKLKGLKNSDNRYCHLIKGKLT